jgi:hypothetical protein
MQDFVKFFKKHSTSNEDEGESMPKMLPRIGNRQNFRTTFTGFNFKPTFNHSQPKMHSSFNGGTNLWLLKPHELNRGRGINLFNKLTTFKNLMNAYQNGPDSNFRIKSESSAPKEVKEEKQVKVSMPRTNKFVV